MGSLVQGESVAYRKEEITEALKRERIRVTYIQRQFSLPAWIYHTKKSIASAREISHFTRQLATLLHAGVPLLQAFDILHRGQNDGRLKAIILNVHSQIEAGVALNQALKQHSEFDALYCDLIAIGELTGMLDHMLERLASHLEKSQALRMTLRAALVYPSAVLGIAIAVLAIILVAVVPAFETIFLSFGADLPWLTQGVVDLSRAIQQNGLLLLVGLILGAFGLHKQVKHRHSWRLYLHGLMLRLPIVGPLTRSACLARWTRTLATLLSAGIPLNEALYAMQGSTGNLLYQEATQSVQSQLIQGRSLSVALEASDDLFPPMVVQMCMIGEESGALDQMLHKAAEHYEREVDSTVARLSTLLEPFIMVVLGLLIGGLVMALYLPIFQLGQVV